MDRCHDCGCAAGEHHSPGCDWEQCPFCGMQLIGCRCSRDVYCREDDGPEDPSASQYEEWESVLKAKGLIPFGSEKRIYTSRDASSWPRTDPVAFYRGWKASQ